MTRKPFFFGKNKIDIKSESSIFDTNVALQADVLLNNASIAKLVAEAGLGHKFYDVDLLLPDPEKPLPDFSRKMSVDIDTLKTFDFTFTQPNKTITQKYCVLLSSGYSSNVYRSDLSLKTPTPFLTNQPIAKHTGANSNEYFFLPINIDNPSPSLNLYLKITMEMADGSLVSFNYLKIEKVINMSVYGFNLSPYQILADQTIQPVGYYFQILDHENNAFSERRYLKIEPSRDEDFNIVLKNSYGFWDCLTIPGTQSRKIKNNRDSILADNKMISGPADFHRAIYLNLAELDTRLKNYFQEIIISDKIFMLEGDFIEIKIETQDFEYLNTADIVESATLEFRFANQEKVY